MNVSLSPTPDSYRISPLTGSDKSTVMELNSICFPPGESYTNHTFDFLFSDPSVIGYKCEGQMGDLIAFIFLMISPDGSAHVTTIGVRPDQRRKGIGKALMMQGEMAIQKRGYSTLLLEVRNSNEAGRALYGKLGFIVVQRLEKYYNDGEDGVLMMKALNLL